jgi:hypothetical protein
MSLPSPCCPTWCGPGRRGDRHRTSRSSTPRTISRPSVALRSTGRLFLQVRAGSYDSVAVVDILRVLLRKVRGRIILIWDGSPIHRGQPVKDFLRRIAGQAPPSGAVARLCA